MNPYIVYKPMGLLGLRTGTIIEIKNEQKIWELKGNLLLLYDLLSKPILGKQEV